MFTRIKRSWYLLKGSMHVLNQDRELLVFPLISSVFLLLIVGTFVIPLFWATDFFSPETMSSTSNTFLYVLMFLFYLISYFITYFFNAAIISCAIFRMKGGNPNLKGGFEAAKARIVPILSWALISATVGFLLKALQNKSGTAGAIGTGILGIAWSVTSYLVIPIIVMENRGPIEALKESAALVKKTWGEQVAGNLGLGLFMMLVMIPALIVIPLTIIFAGSEIILMIIFSALILYAVFVSLVQSTLTAIFDSALYLYARENYVSKGFSGSVLRQSLKEV